MADAGVYVEVNYWIAGYAEGDEVASGWRGSGGIYDDDYALIGINVGKHDPIDKVSKPRERYARPGKNPRMRRWR